MNIQRFKKTLVIFWFLWWLIALWTDIVGGLTHLGLLKASWAPDGNYPFLKESLAMYPLPDWVAPLLFVLIILALFIGTTLFFWAILSLGQDESVWIKRADKAFIFTLSFWLAFFLADQCIMKFDLEENHMVQGGFELLTYLALYCLPSSAKKKSLLMQ